MDRKQVIAYLNTLSISEIGEIINEISGFRREDKEFEGGDFEYLDVVCLVVASFGKFKGKMDDLAFIEAYSTPTVKGGFHESKELTEQGACSRCATQLISNFGEGVCPICYEINELT